jgi:hypothetical protein
MKATAKEIGAYLVEQVQADVEAGFLDREPTSWEDLGSLLDANEYVREAEAHFDVNADPDGPALVNAATAIADRELRAAALQEMDLGTLAAALPIWGFMLGEAANGR